jgi:UDPglucose 6-dehydrogenase
MKPDRIVVGAEDPRAIEMMREIYSPFQRNHDRLILMDVRSAEFTKYAANSMLATRISFMNELANLSDKLGVDIDMVRRGIGADPHIGPSYLNPGLGYGGGCFPKDVKALIHTARDEKTPMDILIAVETVNERQKHILVEKMCQRLGDDLTGFRIALWGLAFKPNTDDMREAPSRVIVRELLQRGATVVAYDPVAMMKAQRVFTDTGIGIEYAKSALESARGANAIVIDTAWKEFSAPDFKKLKQFMKPPSIIFDGWNVVDRESAKAAEFEYFGVGRS